MPDLAVAFPLINTAATAVFIWYLMKTVDGTLKDIQRALQEQARAQQQLALSITLEVLTRPHVPEHARRQADQMAAEIRTAQVAVP